MTNPPDEVLIKRFLRNKGALKVPVGVSRHQVEISLYKVNEKGVPVFGGQGGSMSLGKRKKVIDDKFAALTKSLKRKRYR